AAGPPDRRAQLGQAGKAVRDETVDAGIRKPDRVQHPLLDFCDSRRRVALARKRRHRLRNESVERARYLRRRERVEAAGGVENLHAATASASSTGPSTQSRLISPSISTAQP